MVTGISKAPICTGIPFQSQVTFRMPVAIATRCTARPRSAIRRIPAPAGNLRKAREVPPGRPLVLVIDRGQAPRDLLGHRRDPDDVRRYASGAPPRVKRGGRIDTRGSVPTSHGLADESRKEREVPEERPGLLSVYDDEARPIGARTRADATRAISPSGRSTFCW